MAFDVILVDAIVKKVSGFDGNQVYEAIRKDAFDTPPSDGTEKGRVCLPSYLKYIPQKVTLVRKSYREG